MEVTKPEDDLAEGSSCRPLGAPLPKAQLHLHFGAQSIRRSTFEEWIAALDPARIEAMQQAARDLISRYEQSHENIDYHEDQYSFCAKVQRRAQECCLRVLATLKKERCKVRQGPNQILGCVGGYEHDFYL